MGVRGHDLFGVTCFSSVWLLLPDWWWGLEHRQRAVKPICRRAQLVPQGGLTLWSSSTWVWDMTTPVSMTTNKHQQVRHEQIPEALKAAGWRGRFKILVQFVWTGSGCLTSWDNHVSNQPNRLVPGLWDILFVSMVDLSRCPRLSNRDC